MDAWGLVMTGLKRVDIYTDGACLKNPGPGGYGVVLQYGPHRKELSGGFRLTTNNRMELYAAIAALRALKNPCEVRLFSDSKYVVDAMRQGWARRWRDNGWWRNKANKAVNSDLWAELLELCEQHHIEFFWVKGHAGILENERCDSLAETAAIRHPEQIDTAYEQKHKEPEAPKAKVSEVGQPCRKCATPVIRKKPRKRTRKIGQTHYYAYFLFCEKCGTTYMPEDAKVDIPPVKRRLPYDPPEMS